MQKLDHTIDNHFDVRAPLATFDTIDLGDEDTGRPSNYRCVAINIPEEEEVNVSDSAVSSETGSVVEVEIPTVSISENSIRNVKSTENIIVLENQDNIESVGQYQNISNSCDDDSCQENAEAEADDSNSDSDSSDSEGGYIRSGYISVNKGVVTTVKTQSEKVTVPRERYEYQLGNITPNRTPTSSPHLGYSTTTSKVLEPPPTFSSKSKQKAYEKRLKRLQVTTSPIARPRSTTAINIHSLEEYVNSSSPVQSPLESGDKLKITLPQDEFKTRPISPKKSSKAGHKDLTCLEFDGDLFSHTKSSLLVQDNGSTNKSPRKILIPPALSSRFVSHDHTAEKSGKIPVQLLHLSDAKQIQQPELSSKSEPVTKSPHIG